MTEDDTFRRLARPNFDEMVRIHAAWWRNEISHDQALRIPFMKSYGWTWFEFVMEARERMGPYADLE